jgi:hypothetical protein
MSRTTSHAEKPSLSESMAEIQWTSRKLNRLYGVTGALLVGRHWFIQTLEGSAIDVHVTLARINLDVRHEDLRLFELREVPNRMFADWSMHVSTMGHVSSGLISRCVGCFSQPSSANAPHLLDALMESVAA